MQVGDLVKWTHPRAEDTGIVLKVHGATGGWYHNQAVIQWFGKPDHSGLYPIDHELLEVVSEAR